MVIWRLPEVAPKRAELAARFGRLAAASLGVLVVSGGLMALQHLNLAAGDLETAYARALAAKLAVLLVALALALVATRRAGAARERWLRLEAGALLALLGLAGLLVSLPPPV